MSYDFRKLSRRLIVALALAIIVIASIVTLLPYGATWAITDWLEKQDVDANIVALKIDLLGERVLAEHISGENSAGKGFTIDGLEIEIRWQELWDRKLAITGIRLDHLAMDTASNDKGLYSIAGLETGSSPPPAASTDEQNITPWEITVGDVTIDDIAYCHEIMQSNQRYCLQLDNIQWQGETLIKTAGSGKNELSVASKLSLNKPALKHNDTLVMTVDNIDLVGFNYADANDIKLNGLTVSRLKLFPDADSTPENIPLAQLDKIDVKNINISDKVMLSADQVVITGIDGYIKRNDKGEWLINDKLARVYPAVPESTKSNDNSDATGDGTGNAAPVIKIAELRINSEHSIKINDESKDQTVNIAVQIVTFQIKNIDTSDSSNKSPLKLKLRVDYSGIIELDGIIKPMAIIQDFDLTGTIKGLDLRNVNAFIETDYGHRIKSGQLNANLDLTANNGNLDSTLTLDLKQLQVSSKNDEQSSKLTKLLGLPLNKTLDLLRERDNSIELKVPVTGDITKPEFDTSDTVNKAISSALTSTIISYYTPFGLVTATEGLIALATALHFEPVTFEHGSTELDTENTQYLESIVRLLNERPKLHLVICGYANRQDLSALVPEYRENNNAKPDDTAMKKLLTVAENRSIMIKNHFINIDIAADRLVLCEPEYHKDAIAGVKLSI